VTGQRPALLADGAASRTVVGTADGAGRSGRAALHLRASDRADPAAALLIGVAANPGRFLTAGVAALLCRVAADRRANRSAALVWRAAHPEEADRLVRAAE